MYAIASCCWRASRTVSRGVNARVCGVFDGCYIASCRRSNHQRREARPVGHDRERLRRAAPQQHVPLEPASGAWRAGPRGADWARVLSSRATQEPGGPAGPAGGGGTARSLIAASARACRAGARPGRPSGRLPAWCRLPALLRQFERAGACQHCGEGAFSAYMTCWSRRRLLAAGGLRVACALRLAHARVQRVRYSGVRTSERIFVMSLYCAMWVSSDRLSW